jgi:hypothetical protein
MLGSDGASQVYRDSNADIVYRDSNADPGLGVGDHPRPICVNSCFFPRSKGNAYEAFHDLAVP